MGFEVLEASTPSDASRRVQRRTAPDARRRAQPVASFEGSRRNGLLRLGTLGARATHVAASATKMDANDQTTKNARPTERGRDVEHPTPPGIDEERHVTLLFYNRDGSHLARLAAGESVVVGRDQPADVIINDPSLSRRHARFSFDGDHVVVDDLGSTNGTFVRGEHASRTRIDPGDEVVLANVVASVLRAALAPVEGLGSHVRFRTDLATEMVRARWFRRSVAIVVVRAVRHAVGHVRHWAPRVQALLRPIDHAALYSAETVEVLLPEATLADAKELAQAIVATTASKPPGSPRVVPLFCGVASFPESATGAEELIEVCGQAARAANAATPVVVAPSQGERYSQGGAGEPVVVSATMRELFETAARLARSTIPVLFLGETGTGKEVLARRLHELGPRRDRALVCVNCAAIPPQLVESTLFGHEKGAFTGATGQRCGVFEAANGGTVFLDEVGELPIDAQAALLRVLESKRITRVGGTSELSVDIRVVAATHRDLSRLTASGAFRRDLLYRLNAMTLPVPPLRKRREEIPILAARFLAQANLANQAHVGGIDPDAMALLEAHPWPGNVRELRNVIERGVVIARSHLITVEDLPEDLRQTFHVETQPPNEGAAESHAATPGSRAQGAMRMSAEHAAMDFRAQMDQLEAAVIIEALGRAGWNQRVAARALSMPLRTLVHKIHLHGIKRPGGPRSPG